LRILFGKQCNSTLANKLLKTPTGFEFLATWEAEKELPIVKEQKEKNSKGEEREGQSNRRIKNNFSLICIWRTCGKALS
jgi:hypothetical protein